jgi:ribonuclease D
MHEPCVAVDIESNGFHRYPERICLIQIGVPKGAYILDPLAVEDLEALGVLLSDSRIEKVFHACDYDLRSLDRDYGFRVINVFDTGLAAKFLGVKQTSLKSVLKEFLNIDVEKNQQFQRADWSRRPLPAEMVDYAASDVAYLLPLKDVLVKRVSALGREGWVAEECARMEAVAYVAPEPPEKAFLSIKGSGRLSPRELAVLRELYIFREREALRRGRPPFRVVSNQVLLHLAQNPRADLERVSGLAKGLLHEQGKELRRALKRGLTASPYERPRPVGSRSPWTKSARNRFASLKKWRDERARSLGLEPAPLWPTGSLERLAKYPNVVDEEIGGTSKTGVRRWQQDAYGEEVRKLLKTSAPHKGRKLGKTQP